MKDLKLITHIKALPNDVYAAFTNKKIIEIWTGEPVEFELIKGAEFSWFDGDISGTIIDFEEGKRLIQKWNFGDYMPSIVEINFIPEKKGTRLEIFQKDIPEEDFDNINEGWRESIFESLKDLLEE